MKLIEHTHLRLVTEIDGCSGRTFVSTISPLLEHMRLGGTKLSVVDQVMWLTRFWLHQLHRINQPLDAEISLGIAAGGHVNNEREYLQFLETSVIPLAKRYNLPYEV